MALIDKVCKGGSGMIAGRAVCSEKGFFSFGHGAMVDLIDHSKSQLISRSNSSAANSIKEHNQCFAIEKMRF